MYVFNLNLKNYCKTLTLEIASPTGLDVGLVLRTAYFLMCDLC